MRFLGEFEAPDADGYARGQAVVVRSDRGQELGEVLCESTPRAIGLIVEPTRGQIVRRCHPDDQAAVNRMRQRECDAFEACQRFIAQRKLQMDLVDVEWLFG